MFLFLLYNGYNRNIKNFLIWVVKNKYNYRKNLARFIIGLE